MDLCGAPGWPFMQKVPCGDKNVLLGLSVLVNICSISQYQPKGNTLGILFQSFGIDTTAPELLSKRSKLKHRLSHADLLSVQRLGWQAGLS